ncbi:MAG TPA: tetratricopeptide repeat protein [Thermomicrobiales bacterium]|nr:tetratricopeptide repeat protein [Thermomicrobiales bacterium]
MAKLPDISEAIAFDENLREIPRWPERIAYAIRRGRKQLQQARDDGNETQILRTLGYLTDACRVFGELDAAVAYGREAVERSLATANRNAEVANLIRLGEAHKYRDEHAIAEPLFRAALDLTTDGDAEVLRDFALQHLGKCLLEMGRYDEAITYLEQALALRQAKKNQPLIDSTEQALALARTQLEAHEK